MDIISYSKARSVEKQLNQAVAAGDQLAETQQARVGRDTTVYTTLKERLDAEQTQVTGRVTTVENQLSEQNKATQILTHGVQVVNATTSSPLKVEIYGRSLVNIFGTQFNSWRKGDIDWSTGNVVASTDRLVNNEFIPIQANRYYLLTKLGFSGAIQFYDANKNILNKVNFDGTNYYKFTHASASFVKFLLLAVTNNAETLEVAWNKVKPALYSVSADTYNKIGVSLLDADVERMFPYVNSIGYVKNPVLLAESDNIIDIYAELSKIDSTKVNRLAGNEIELIPALTAFNNKVIGTFVKNTQYTFTCDIRHEGTITRGLYFIVDYTDGTIDNLTVNDVDQPYQTVTVTSKAGKSISGLRLSYGTSTTKTFLRNFRINIGTVSRQYTAYNPSYLYCSDVTLAGNDNKKDILYRSEFNNRWEVLRQYKINEILDGTRGWTYSGNYTGFKQVRIPNNGAKPLSEALGVKYDGNILKPSPTSVVINNEKDAVYIDASYTYLSISDADSGWTTAPTVDMIKSYFNGWKYTGDGTTHSWVSLVDGSVPATNTLAYVSTTMATGFTPYKLTYQLASPVIEEVKVDGDLVVNGATQVTVGSEFTYTEDAITKKRTYTITPTAQRTGANLLEVKCTYDSNFKSSYDSTVGKVNNIAESVSVLDMQMYRVLLALKNNNITV
ncbi:hypothetical protein [Schinkia azotoformans]|uniref:hypothetical protein n=1 Tax=Schinkia azotoformans TaxID=1454 RepID=UPI002DBA8817|nr:hypothetical protein [Schinkia azotoformans]MEC1757365.1 hypothetical protein [Schinkia azotoformans]